MPLSRVWSVSKRGVRSGLPHPLVFGAGELQALNDVVLDVCRPDGSTIAYPEFMAARCAETDRRELLNPGSRLAGQDGARGTQSVTDKMPSNYCFAGLIHLALPNARIIGYDPGAAADLQNGRRPLARL